MNRQAWMRRATMTALTLGTLMGGQSLSTIAHASTTTSVKSVHIVYLRSGAQLGRNGIVLEPVNTQFTVLSGGTSGWWHVQDPKGRHGYVIRNTRWIVPNAATTTTSTNPTTIPTTTSSTTTPPATTSTSTDSTSGYQTTTQLPPGVTIDPSVTPLAPLTAAWQQKYDAVLTIAQSKLGTPYEWGHNEDRGQTGFDCSNFTAYVYHHALGYKFSGASQVQNKSVGTPVPNSDMRPGDLLIFNNGGHVGIYIGNGEMIEEGGGLGKVGYLSVKPGSYWGNHLTSVRRMF